VNASAPRPIQKLLVQELPNCVDALSYFQVTVEAARRQPPQGTISGYLRAVEHVKLAARMLARQLSLSGDPPSVAILAISFAHTSTPISQGLMPARPEAWSSPAGLQMILVPGFAMGHMSILAVTY
jgi:hypothetical protein